MPNSKQNPLDTNIYVAKRHSDLRMAKYQMVSYNSCIKICLISFVQWEVNLAANTGLYTIKNRGTGFYLTPITNDAEQGSFLVGKSESYSKWIIQSTESGVMFLYVHSSFNCQKICPLLIAHKTASELLDLDPEHHPLDFLITMVETYMRCVISVGEFTTRSFDTFCATQVQLQPSDVSPLFGTISVSRSLSRMFQRVPSQIWFFEDANLANPPRQSTQHLETASLPPRVYYIRSYHDATKYLCVNSSHDEIRISANVKSEVHMRA